jgi:hypothetical protein
MAFELITTSKISVFLVDHDYENQNVEKNEKNIESLSFVKFLKLLTAEAVLVIAFKSPPPTHPPLQFPKKCF